MRRVGGRQRTVKSVHLLAIYFLEMLDAIKRSRREKTEEQQEDERKEEKREEGSITTSTLGKGSNPAGTPGDTPTSACYAQASQFQWLADVPPPGSNQIITGIDFAPEVMSEVMSFLVHQFASLKTVCGDNHHISKHEMLIMSTTMVYLVYLHQQAFNVDHEHNNVF